MAASERRNHERIKHRANIQVMTSQDVHTLEMRDFSESGLYLFCVDTSIVAINDQIRVQTLEMADAPVLDAVVVRLENNIGFAVHFTQ